LDSEEDLKKWEEVPYNPGKRPQSAFDSSYHKTVLDVRVEASVDSAFGAGWAVWRRAQKVSPTYDYRAELNEHNDGKLSSLTKSIGC
jgi:hypothetical protein